MFKRTPFCMKVNSPEFFQNNQITTKYKICLVLFNKTEQFTRIKFEEGKLQKRIFSLYPACQWPYLQDLITVAEYDEKFLQQVFDILEN